MRLVIDSLIAMMLVAILAGIILHYRQQQRVAVAYQQAHQELSQLRESLIYHSALERDVTNQWGFPSCISPTWFPQGLPMNALIPGRHPWMDIAPPGDMNDHPPDPVICRESQAGYWYNPNRGVIRARVPEQFTEYATLTLYNQINSTSLLSLPRSHNPQRTPLPHPQLQPVVASSTSSSSAPAPHTLNDLSKQILARPTKASSNAMSTQFSKVTAASPWYRSTTPSRTQELRDLSTVTNN